ncbi:hypothetical protein [Pseudolabrys sp. FHR47]|uniref:hypothetical protein n=1 Tax=Pseudolabrys sp. FHR47 TaxID=2562284 RepID=UPI0010BF0FDC|nr:hypothetical protein [Pseudolabrys sp. FHR47]
MNMRAVLLSTILASTIISGAAIAQQQPSEQPAAQQPRESQSHTPQTGNDSGTKPENMGSTGWTGGTGGSHIGTSNTLTEQGDASKGTTGAASDDTKTLSPNSEAAKDQPLMATGVDLKGPPTRFPANQTPE